MSLNPFTAVLMTPDGPCEIVRSVVDRTVHLCFPDGRREVLTYEGFEARYGVSASDTYGSRPRRPSPFPPSYGFPPAPRKPAIGSPEWRGATWRRRMVRMKDKIAQRRWARVERAAWLLGWTWGGGIASALTIYLIKWLTALTLG